MKAILISLVLTASYANADIVQLITKEAKKQGLDPKIALAVAQVESGLNPNAVGPQGELGLFQLHPKFFNQPRILDPALNAKLGIQHLLYWKKFCPVKNNLEWVSCFNAGPRKPRYPTLLPYYKKFIREYRG